MTFTITTNPDDAVQLFAHTGAESYACADIFDQLTGWLGRGDDVIVFELADLSVMPGGRYPLYWAMPWERDEPTPRQAPDTKQCGLGWRYVPAMRVTVEPVEVTP